MSSAALSSKAADGRFSPVRIGQEGEPLPALPDYASVRASVGAAAISGENAASLARRRMADVLEEGQQRVYAFFEAGGDADRVHRALARLYDATLQGALDLAAGVYPNPNPSLGEELAVVAVGGYGRGEMAPHSDIDLLFLHPYKRTPHLEQTAEFLLYRLWDLGLKVGQSVRSIDECLKLARNDLTIETALLEGRLIWGSAKLWEELRRRQRQELVPGREAQFIEAKLAEREARHRRAGDSRYLLEPNIKEGKGGLRDLHTLMWLGRFLWDVKRPHDMVEHGALTEANLRTYLQSRLFLRAVRCHLHYITDRAEERLTFDLQPRVASRMLFREASNERNVERFMRRYYLVARDVGVLTRVVCTALEDQHKRKPLLAWARFGFGRRGADGLVIQGNRVGLAEPDLLERQPIKILELFAVAQARGADVHPEAYREVERNLFRVRGLRGNGQANELFLAMLTSRQGPMATLSRLNETGVLSRFLPEWARIAAQFQHNLYHVYTTDEHTIRALQALHDIEAGKLADDHPLSTRLVRGLQPQSRRELYVALLLHDIGKGQGGSHSEIGAKIAAEVCPRLGLSVPSTETVVWLVRHHLFMSGYAFKRDLEDPKTIADFVGIVQSPERLRLLLLLTVCDIRAVGPSVWNGWKGQLLRELHAEAEAAMASDDLKGRRAERVAAAKERARDALGAEPGWDEAAIEHHLERFDPRYWLTLNDAARLRHAAVMREADLAGRQLTLDFEPDPFEARTRVSVYAADHPGLFMKLAGALALSGVSIVDAYIFTTSDGMAMDTLGCQEVGTREAVTDPARLERVRANVVKALAGEIWLERELEGKRLLPTRADVFEVEPRVLINNEASRTHSVIEINGRDRVGLLFDLAKALKELGLIIHSAHIVTYGERVVDVFYVKDVFGLKVDHPGKLRRVRRRLEEALRAT